MERQKRTHQSQLNLEFMRHPVPADISGKRAGVVAYDVNGSASWEGLGPATGLLKTENLEFRSYEFSIAKKIFEGKNTLVIIPTGKGKTILELLSAANAMDSGKRALFVAATKPLVQQHYDEATEKFRDSSGIRMLVGSVGVKKRDEIGRSAKLIIGTPETAVNDIKNGRIKLDDFGVLIVDESQRTRGGYAYSKLAEMFNEKNIQVVSFTGSLSSLKPTAGTIMVKLKVDNVEVRDWKDKDIRPYMKTISVDKIEVEKSAKMLEIEAAFNRLIKFNFEAMRKAGLLSEKEEDTSFNFGALAENKPKTIDRFEDMPRRKFLALQEDAMSMMKKVVSDQFAPEEGGVKLAGAKSFIKLTYIAHAYDMFQTQGFKPALDYLDTLRNKTNKNKSLKELLYKHRSLHEAYGLMRDAVQAGEEHPKVAAFIELVKKNPDEKIMVFANYKSTVGMLVNKLKDVGIDARPFMGQRGGMTQKAQRQTMDDFSNSKFNPIISTSIGEEGMDFKGAEPSFVICYDALPSGIRTRQREGRTGRRMPGRVVTLITKDTNEEAFYSVASWRKGSINRINNMLRKGEIIPIMHQSGEDQKPKAVQSEKPAEKIKSLTGSQLPLLEIRRHYDPG